MSNTTYSDSEEQRTALETSVRTRRHYSSDLKERIVYQRFSLSRKPSEIAVELDIPLGVAQRTLQLWNEIGVVARDPKGYARQGRPTVLNHVACNVSGSCLFHSIPCTDIHCDPVRYETLRYQAEHVLRSDCIRTIRLH